MMRRSTLLLLATLVTSAAGCSRCANEEHAGDAAVSRESSGVDPMAFVLVYQTDFERILAKHGDDCEGALTSLLRFIADRKDEFLDRLDREPAGGQPATAGDQPVQMFMRFAERCPGQVVRLNDMLHRLSP